MFGKRTTVPATRIASAIDGAINGRAIVQRVKAIDEAWRAVLSAGSEDEHAKAAERFAQLVNN